MFSNKQKVIGKTFFSGVILTFLFEKIKNISETLRDLNMVSMIKYLGIRLFNFVEDFIGLNGVPKEFIL